MYNRSLETNTYALQGEITLSLVYALDASLFQDVRENVMTELQATLVNVNDYRGSEGALKFLLFQFVSLRVRKLTEYNAHTWLDVLTEMGAAVAWAHLVFGIIFFIAPRRNSSPHH